MVFRRATSTTRGIGRVGPLFWAQMALRSHHTVPVLTVEFKSLQRWHLVFCILNIDGFCAKYLLKWEGGGLGPKLL
jgi:hypothetical protein